MAKKKEMKKNEKAVPKKRGRKPIIEIADEIVKDNTEVLEAEDEAIEELEAALGNDNEDVPQEETPMEVVNGDPSVLQEVEKAKEETLHVEEVKKESSEIKEVKKTTTNNHKNTRMIDKSFGYSWNGMEIDF